MSGRWFRMYDELLDDPKVQMLSPETFKAWVNILCLASRNDGALPDAIAIAFALRLDDRKAERILAELTQRRLLDQVGNALIPHGWNGRQYKSDVSTDRVKQHRERKRNVSHDVSETPPDTDTETEQNKDASHPLRVHPAPENDGWPEDCFDQWYRIFPRHVGKDDAKRSFDRLRKSRKVTWPDLLDATEQFAHQIRQRPPEDPKFIPHPATWLNKGRWADEPDPQLTYLKPITGNHRHDRGSALNAAFDELEARHLGAEDPGPPRRGPDVLREDFGRGVAADRGSKLL